MLIGKAILQGALGGGRLPRARPMSESLPHDLPPLITRYRWRKTFGTVLALGVVTAAIAVVWFYFVRAPGPRAVCDHVDTLRHRFPKHAQNLRDTIAPLAVSGSSRPPTQSTDQQCMWFFTTEQKQLGFFDYGQLARCVTLAESPQQIFPCFD